MSTSAIDALLEEHRVLICAGTGGVGKTTCSAALARRAARPLVSLAARSRETPVRARPSARPRAAACKSRSATTTRPPPRLYRGP